MNSPKHVAAGMTSKDGQLVGPNGQPLFFHGINWCALLASVLLSNAGVVLSHPVRAGGVGRARCRPVSCLGVPESCWK